MNRTCFHDVNLESGAKMVEMFGYELPWEYSAGSKAEHLATRQKAGCVDLGYMAKFHIEGLDAQNFLQMLLTTDVGTLKKGQILYSAICDENGYMIDDATVWKYGENDYILITGDERDAEWIIRQAEQFNVHIRNDTFNTGALQLQGPMAHDIMRIFSGLNPDTIKYYHFKELIIDDRHVVLAKMSFTGSGGFEFHVANKDARWLWETLLDIGNEYEILPMGQCALESLRQEGGYLLVGNDHDKTVNPLEAGIAQTVNFSKPNFIGKQALLKIANEGISKRIVWFSIADGTEPIPGNAVILQNKHVGFITSGSHSPDSGKGVAMGYVQVANAFPGQVYKIITGGKEHDANLSLVPLYDADRQVRRQ